MERRAPTAMRIDAFDVATSPVTNSEFWPFVKENPAHWPSHWSATPHGETSEPFSARLRALPVVNVTADAARLYCAWAGLSLPTWFEWEIAACGRLRLMYPWGNEYDPRLCNSVESGRGGLAAVHEFPAGRSGAGVAQMAGNVFEWVAAASPGEYELRGGSFRVPCGVWGMGTAFRREAAGFRGSDVGFRVVRRRVVS